MNGYGSRKRTRTLSFGLLWIIAPSAACIGGGTSMEWFKNGFLDPTQVGQFAEPRRNEILSTLGILEEPGGIQFAEEPTEADLIAEYTEPVIQPGDVVSVSIFELVNIGISTDLQIQIRNSGFETMPVLGRIRIAGFTARDLELELKQVLRDAQILDDAEVRVSLLRSQEAQFSAIGFVSNPGPYAIPRPDFRLLDAVAIFGGIPSDVEKIYISRRPGMSGDLDGADNVGGLRMEDFEVSPDASRSTDIFTMSDASLGPAGPFNQSGDLTSRPTSRTSPIDELSILEGGASGEAVQPWEFDEKTGDWVLRSATQPASAPTRPASQPTTSNIWPDPEAQEPEPFTEPDDAMNLETTRIIEISVKDLMQHDPRYNVIIRPHDVITVPPIEQGEYYMAGHVARPGAYRFSGRYLTVKEAIVSAGGFDALAWPARADLSRRVNKFEEQIIQVDLDAIFAGKAPDFYLKPNDLLNVGTTPIAPFLAVLRNSFRMSYGFGFVYDRNFADKDSFGAQEQRKNRKRVEAQSRGLPF